MSHGYEDESDIAVLSLFEKQEFFLACIYLNFSVHISLKPGSFSICKVTMLAFHAVTIYLKLDIAKDVREGSGFWFDHFLKVSCTSYLCKLGCH